MAEPRWRAQPTRRTYSTEFGGGGIVHGRARSLAIAGVVVAVFTIGLGIGRASAPSSAPGAGAVQQAAQQDAGSPGNHAGHTQDGVALGFDRTQTGAVAAATEFATVLAGPLLVNPPAYRAATQTIAAPDAQQVLLQQAEAALSGLQQTYGINTDALQPTRVLIRSFPLAWHVQQYSADAAQVGIWLQTMIAEDGRLAPLSSWATATYSLAWVNADWRLVSDSSSDGPAPAVPQPAPTTTQIPDQLNGWAAYTTVPTG